MKKFTLFLLILLVGGLSGILSSQFLIPYLGQTPPFSKINWLKQAGGNGTTIINKTEQIIVEESLEVEKAVDKISPSVVGIVSRSKLTSKTKKAGQTFYGTGFITTGDGLILTNDFAAPEGSFDYFISRDNQSLPAEVEKRDAESGLVLLRIKETNLPVVSFGEADGLRLGQKVVLVGADASLNPLLKIVNFGVVRNLVDKSFSVSIVEKNDNLTGAPIINIKGEVLGLAEISSSGLTRIISEEQIRKFLGQ